MDYQVLALKYRPARFDEVLGQDQVTSVLQGALAQKRIANAYLFSGPRGCGKTSTARLLAKALNCEQGPTPEPCGECESCRSIARGSSLAVIEIDAASTGRVEDIRDIREEAALASIGGRYKIYILDEAHQISAAGANALLKTLEEPPPGTVFVLATTELQKIIPTIHSRCQRFAFRLLSVDEITDRLTHIAEREKMGAEPEVLRAIARRAEGSMRDGLTLLDQVLASVEGEITLEAVTDILGLTCNDRFFALTEAWLERDGARALRELDDVLAGGLAIREFGLGLARWFRNLLLLKLDPSLLAGEMGIADLEQAGRYATAFETEDLLYLARLVGERADQIRYASQPRIMLETLVVEIARFESRVLLAEILARLSAMEGAGGGRSEGGQAGSPRGKGSAGGGASAAGRGTGSTGRSAGSTRSGASAAGRGTGSTRGGASEPSAGAAQDGAYRVPSASDRSRVGKGGGGAAAGIREPAPTSAAGSAPVQARASVSTAAGPPAAAGEFDPNAFWGDFVRRVGRGKKSLGSFLAHARPGSIGARHFTVLVENPFHLAMLDTPEHMRLLAETFTASYGQTRQIRVQLVEAEAAAKPERISQERADTARREQGLADHAGDDLIQDLLKRFDGEVLED